MQFMCRPAFILAQSSSIGLYTCKGKSPLLFGNNSLQSPQSSSYCQDYDLHSKALPDS